MNSANCEEVILAKMALIDGERSSISDEELAVHLAQCRNCLQEIEQLENTVNLFTGYERQRQESDLWPEIEERLTRRAKTDSPWQWKIFLVLGALLVIYKLLELLGSADGLSFFFKFVPLILGLGVFLLLKENPLKINANLNLER